MTNDYRPFRIIVAGSRDIPTNKDYLREYFNRLDALSKSKSNIEVVSGTARGGDRVGEDWAYARNHKLVKFPADWQYHGLSAGYKRNEEMAEYADALVAIWDSKSKGTKHMINIAKREGLAVRIISTQDIAMRLTPEKLRA
jgi:4-hydroxy-3-methylbut-2-enyl diphosphate reductase IspH